MRGDTHWGVTVLQAVHDYDAGEVWAWEPFAVRPGASKSSVYRREVTQAAVVAVQRALQRFVPGQWQPAPEGAVVAHGPGRWLPLMPQAERHIDWQRDDTGHGAAQDRGGRWLSGRARCLLGPALPPVRRPCCQRRRGGALRGGGAGYAGGAARPGAVASHGGWRGVDRPCAAGRRRPGRAGRWGQRAQARRHARVCHAGRRAARLGGTADAGCR